MNADTHLLIDVRINKTQIHGQLKLCIKLQERAECHLGKVSLIPCMGTARSFRDI